MGGASLALYARPIPALIRAIDTLFVQVLFTNAYSKQFLIFVAMAVLHSHRDVILRYLTEVRLPPFSSR